MKRGYDMTGQLALVFTFDDPQEERVESDLVQVADNIIRKYLRIRTNTLDMCQEAPYKSPKWCRGRKAADNAIKACTQMILQLGMKVAYFFPTEERWSHERSLANNHYNESQKHKQAEHQKNADEVRWMLDAFGYIQQVFDHDNRTQERYLEDGDEFDPDNCEGFENGKPIGYWYWLFEDHITQIPVPIPLLTKYYQQYGKAI